MKSYLKPVLLVLLVIAWLMAVAATNTRSTGNFNQTYNFRSTGTHANTETNTLNCAGATCAAGTYQVAVDMGVTTAATAGSGTVTITVNDGTASRTLTVGPINLGATTGYASGTAVFDYDGAGTLTMGHAVTAGNTTSGLVEYINVSLRRLR